MQRRGVCAEWKQLLGVQLGAVRRFLTLAAGCGPALQGELVFLVMRLCHEHAACIAEVRGLNCRVVAPDATGAPVEQDVCGVALLQQLLGHNRSEVARACACSVLGQVALAVEIQVDEVAIPGTGTHLSAEELRRVYQGEDGAGCVEEDVAPRTRQRHRDVPIRGLLFQQGALEPMLEALFDATAALVQRQGPPGSGNGAAGSAGGSGAVVGTQRGKRGSLTKASLQVWRERVQT